MTERFFGVAIDPATLSMTVHSELLPVHPELVEGPFDKLRANGNYTTQGERSILLKVATIGCAEPFSASARVTAPTNSAVGDCHVFETALVSLKVKEREFGH